MKTKIFLIIISITTIGIAIFFGLKRWRTTQAPTIQQTVEVITPTPPVFEYEKYDKVFGTSGPKAIFFTDLFYPRNIKMYNQLQTLADKGVFEFTVRLIPWGTGLSMDTQRIGEKLVSGFTNCVKLLYPENYTNYLITLQTTYTVPNFTYFIRAEDFALSLKQHLPSKLQPSIIRCVQENSYSDLANRETDYYKEVGVSGSPDLYFPDLGKHINGYNDSNYFISELWKVMDLSSFGYKKVDTQQQIKDIVR